MKTLNDLIEKKRLGNQLRVARKAADKSQDEAAECLSLQRLSYGKYERGESKIWGSHLNQLAKFYNCSIEFFFE